MCGETLHDNLWSGLGFPRFLMLLAVVSLTRKKDIVTQAIIASTASIYELKSNVLSDECKTAMVHKESLFPTIEWIQSSQTWSEVGKQWPWSLVQVDKVGLACILRLAHTFDTISLRFKELYFIIFLCSEGKANSFIQVQKYIGTQMQTSTYTPVHTRHVCILQAQTQLDNISLSLT